MNAPLALRQLYSRHSIVASVGVGLYQALDKHGLRLPAQRLIAQECLTSAATLSRRLGETGMLERVIRLMVRLCVEGFPSRHPMDDTVESWLPADEVELRGARVWLALQYVALGSPQVAEEVTAGWAAQQERLAQNALRDHSPSPVMLEAAHAMIAGLTVRQCVDASFTHADAVAILHAALDAMTSPGMTSPGVTPPDGRPSPSP